MYTHQIIEFMKKAFLLLMLMIFCITLTAQTMAKNDPLKFDADYYLMERDFTKALTIYQNILRSEPDNADIKYKAGICYLNSEDEKDKAISYLEEAALKVSEKYNHNSFKETNAPVDVLFLLGSAYRVNNQIDKAIDAYSKYKSFLDPKDEYNINVVDQYLRSCELAGTMLQNPVHVMTTNLGSPVNTESPNYNAVLSGDGKTMFYTSPARQGYDIFLTTFADTSWSVPRNVTAVLGAGKYMKTSDLSFDGLTLLLTLDNPMNADIFVSRFNKGRWSKVESIGKEINSKYNETHASLSTDGRILYFTSDRKGGQGDLDLYKAESDGEDSWSKPENLGPVINTPFNEETPFITEIGDRLFFSSEGHNSIGGYDIFYYDFSNPSTGVVNLGYPLNTTDNDLFFVPSGDGQTAYYAFAGDDSKGGRDIYQVYINPSSVPQTEEMLTVADEISTAIQDTAEVAALMDTVVSPIAEMPVADTIIAPIAPVDELAEITPDDLIIQTADSFTELPDLQIIEPAVAESIAETVLEEPEPELAASVEHEPAKEVVPELSFSPVSVTGNSYRVQIMALRKLADLRRFNELNGVKLAVNGDRWYRYTVGNTTDREEAEKLLADMKSKGYSDAFIRPNSVYPLFTIQVMAVPGPVVSLERFSNLPAISVVRGQDSFCRYTTGEFATREDALSNLGRIKELGYPTAFVTRMK